MPSSLSLLQARLKPVVSRRAGVALAVWGEPGVGKTHTVQELLRQTPCRNLSLHSSTTLAQLVEKLPQSKRLPVWVERVLEQIAKGQTVDSSAAISTLTALLTEATPFVVHLEDLHDASPDQAAFWQDLAGAIAQTKGLGLIVTSRTEPPEPFSSYRLMPFSAEESIKLLEAEVGSALPKSALEWIFARAKGNPLFTLEYFRYLARQGHLWSDGRAWHWRNPPEKLVPVSVEALIEQWLSEANQDPVLEKVLSTRALLPQIDPNTWAKIAGLSLKKLAGAIGQLEAREILRQNSFVHPLYPEVLLKNLAPIYKQTLACQLIQVLGDREPQTAALFVGDAELEAEDALKLLRQAATQSKDNGNTLQAGRFLAQAANYARGEQRGHLAFEAARLLENADYSECIRLCELALADLAQNLDLIWYTAAVYSEMGQLEQTQKTLLRLPEEHRSGPEWVTRILRTSILDVKEKVELWKAHPEVHDLVDPLAIYRVAYSLNSVGEHPQARQMAMQILERKDLSPLSQAQMCSVIATSYYNQQKAALAVEWNQKALDILRRLEHKVGIAAVLGNQAHALEDQDRYPEAMANYQEALPILSELGNPFAYAPTLRNLGEFHHWYGEYEQAEALQLEATQIFSRSGTTEYLVDCGRDLCALYLDWNKPQSVYLAKKYAQMGWQMAQKLEAPRILLKGLVPVIQAERASGNIHHALELAQQACALNEQVNPKQNSPYVERGLCLEALGRSEEALQDLRHAFEIAKGEGPRFPVEAIGLEIDRISGNVDSAMRRLEQFKKWGFTNNIRVALRQFPALAERHQQEANPIQTIQTTLRLEVLGPMRLDGEAIQGAKRQELLGLLLEARLAGRAEAKQLDLLDMLYPEESEEKALAALKKLIHTVRSRFGSEIIVTTAGGYALGAVGSDVEEYILSDQASLWRGGFLEGLQTHDETVREALYQSLATTTQPLLETDPKEAVRLGRILTEAEPYNPEFWRLNLRALRASNNHKSLNRAYAEAKERMLEVGETLPKHWSEFIL